MTPSYQHVHHKPNERNKTIMKKFLKENIKFIIFIILMTLVVNIELPYYIEAPGGTINLSKRIDPNYSKKNGSLNMLYVTEYKGNVVTVLLSKVIKSWDLFEIKNQQISNENADDIYQRNKVMLENSIQNATLVAYNYANKKIDIKETKNIVIATTKENGLKIGDIIISIDNLPITDTKDIKEYLDTLNVNDKVKLIIKRNNKEKELTITLEEDKLLGIMMVTNYEYDTEEPLNINFKSGEGGSSGGLILSLGIYSEITGIDLLKGRNIAGTGTIDIKGNVGEIDGIKYKIAGAVKNNIDIILVSPYNYEEAKKVVAENNYKIELVCVKTFKEAVDYLTK